MRSAKTLVRFSNTWELECKLFPYQEGVNNEKPQGSIKKLEG